MFDDFYDDDDAEQYPHAYGIPRWWPRFPLDPAFRCRGGCGATNVKANSLCIDCEFKASLPVMEAELDAIRESS
jgi:hypothetical protein